MVRLEEAQKEAPSDLDKLVSETTHLKEFSSAVLGRVVRLHRSLLPEKSKEAEEERPEEERKMPETRVQEILFDVCDMRENFNRMQERLTFIERIVGRK